VSNYTKFSDIEAKIYVDISKHTHSTFKSSKSTSSVNRHCKMTSTGQ